MVFLKMINLNIYVPLLQIHIDMLSVISSKIKFIFNFGYNPTIESWSYVSYFLISQKKKLIYVLCSMHWHYKEMVNYQV